jgi:hypothetical protein
MENGQEGQCNCREEYHRWMVHVVPFLVIGMPRGSSWLGRYGLVKLESHLCEPLEIDVNPWKNLDMMEN